MNDTSELSIALGNETRGGLQAWGCVLLAGDLNITVFDRPTANDSIVLISSVDECLRGMIACMILPSGRVCVETYARTGTLLLHQI